VQREFLLDLPGVYTKLTVEKQVSLYPGSSHIRYPDAMKKARIEGDVVAEFVVDAEGRMRPGTFRVLRSTAPEFTDAVREGLRTARFYPAEVAGQKVAQLVQEPFTFRITSSF
jgi:TonB family protein